MFTSLLIVAICHSGCIHGECTDPENCTCDLGWTGFTCNTGIPASSIYPFGLVELLVNASQLKKERKIVIILSCVAHKPIHNNVMSCVCVHFHWSHLQQFARVIVSMEAALPQIIALVILLGPETHVTMVIYLFIATTKYVRHDSRTKCICLHHDHTVKPIINL